MAATSIIDPEDFGLEIGSLPVRLIKPRSHRKTMPGWFPTRKGVAGPIRTETTLEMRGLRHFEFDPDVVRMAGQPHHLTYFVRQPSGRFKKHVFTPDVALLLRDGDVAVVDFKAERFAQAAEWRELHPFIEEAYLRDHGVVFTVRTELELDIEPRASNLSTMMGSRPIVQDLEAEMAVRAALFESGFPTTIGALRARVSLPHERPEVDRTFSALVGLAFAGDVRLDMGRFFDDATAIVAPTV